MIATIGVDNPPFTAGAIKTELVDSKGLVSACQGWQPMRTVAQRGTKDSKGGWPGCPQGCL